MLFPDNKNINLNNNIEEAWDTNEKK